MYSQIWHKAIDEGCLAEISPFNIHTLIVLSRYMDKSGYCHPGEKLLSKRLGLSINGVSKRIACLKKARYKGKPIIEIKQTKPKNIKGQLVWGHNTYQLSEGIQELISIFKETDGIKVGTVNNSDNIKENPIKYNQTVKKTDSKNTGDGKGGNKQEPMYNYNEQQDVADLKNQLKRFGLKEKKISELIDIHGLNEVRRVLNSTNKKKGINNPAGFIINALKKEYDLETEEEKQYKQFRDDVEKERRKNQESSEKRTPEQQARMNKKLEELRKQKEELINKKLI